LGGVSHGLRHRRCERCGRDSHLTRNCYATTLASGEPLSTSDDEYDNEWDD
jgi:ribosomal protein L37E